MLAVDMLCIIDIEDIIEMIASDSNTLTIVGSMCLLVVRCIVRLYHSGNGGFVQRVVQVSTA